MRLIFALISALSIAACATAETAQRTKTLADASPEPSAEVTPPRMRADDPLSLIAAIYGAWPNGGEGTPTITIEMTPEGGGFVATVIQTGLADDAVAATKDELRIIMDRGGKWFVTSASQWRKCYRTGMFEWTTRPCP